MRILAGFEDGGAASRGALRLARALCELTGSELIVASAPRGTADLAERALAEDVDLLVIGAGEPVPDDAPCAVVVARPDEAETPFRLRRVAVAYDGSTEAAVALELAAGLADSAGASLLLVAAVETNGAGPAARAAEQERMRRHLERAAEKAPSAVEPEERLVTGHAADVLLALAAEADLLVLGSRANYGPAGRLVIGSLAEAALRDSICPTLIAPSA